MELFERVRHGPVIIAVIVAVVVGARLLSFAYLSSLASENPSANPYPIVAGDSSYYARWAENLLALHAYEDPPGKPLRAAPPGYPLLLAAMKAVTGSMTPIVFVQIIFAAYAAVLIYKMARTLVPSAFALVVALAYAIDPMVVFTDSAILTDGLFSLLLICIVYLAFFLPTPVRATPACAGHADRHAGGQTGQSRLKGVARWALVGLLLGIATMLRPIGQFLVFVFPAMYLLRLRMQGGSEDGSRIKAICACVVAFALVVVPWMARNQIQFGSFEISPLGGHNLLTYDVRGFLAWRALADTPNPLPAVLVLRHANDPIFAEIDAEVAEELAAITPEGKNPDNYEGRLAIQYIMRDPLRYAYFHAVNTVPFFISSSVATYRQIVRQLRDNEGFYAPTAISLLGSLERIRNPESFGSFAGAVRSIAPIALEILWWTLVAFSALFALVRFRRNFTILLCAILVVYFAVLTGPMSASRYRIPAESYLLILAAAGAYEITQRAKEKLRASVTAVS